jgi:hypothetical protein
MTLKYWSYEKNAYLSLEDYTELKYERALSKALKVTRLPKNAMTIKLIAQKAMEAVQKTDERTEMSLALIDDEVMEAMKQVEIERGLR